MSYNSNCYTDSMLKLVRRFFVSEPLWIPYGKVDSECGLLVE